MNIPSLCIHLDRDANTKFEYNAETHLKPCIGTPTVDQMFAEALNDKKDKGVYNITDKHQLTFLDRIAKDLKIEIEEIIDFELNCYDCHKPAIGGLHNEFIYSPRIDNLATCISSLDALIGHQKLQQESRDVSIICLFDHEEVGSSSAQGADSNMLVETTERIFWGLRGNAPKEDFYRAIHKSLLVSADMAHAVHPNYSEKHQSQHQPKLHDGIVFKWNANQRYVTDTAGSALLREIAAKNSIPMQDFMIK